MMARLGLAAVLVSVTGAGWALAQGTPPSITAYRIYVNGELVLDSTIDPNVIVRTLESDQLR